MNNHTTRIFEIKDEFDYPLIDSVLFYIETNDLDIEEISAVLKKDSIFCDRLMLSVKEDNLLRKSDGFYSTGDIVEITG